jgi:hypothetical protein
MMTQTHKLSSRWIFFFVLLLILLTWTVPAAAQQDNQPLIIVVRDGAGNPLAGITLDILLTGPPHEPYDNCVTDDSGQCTLLISPGAYLIYFELGWRGREFVPVEEQNAGTLDHGGLGGFGIYFEPSDTEQIVTFVIGQDRSSGLLVPLWDMSRDPDAPPQPYAYPQDLLDDPEEALAAYDLGELNPEITGSISQEDLAATATAQVLLSAAEVPEASASEAPEAVAIAASPAAETEAYSSLPGEALGLAMLGLLMLVLIVGGVVFLIKRRQAQ